MKFNVCDSLHILNRVIESENNVVVSKENLLAAFNYFLTYEFNCLSEELAVSAIVDEYPMPYKDGKDRQIIHLYLQRRFSLKNDYLKSHEWVVQLDIQFLKNAFFDKYIDNRSIFDIFEYHLSWDLMASKDIDGIQKVNELIQFVFDNADSLYSYETDLKATDFLNNIYAKKFEKERIKKLG